MAHFEDDEEVMQESLDGDDEQSSLDSEVEVVDSSSDQSSSSSDDSSEDSTTENPSKQLSKRKKQRNSLSVIIGTYHSAMAQFDIDLSHGEVSQMWIDTSATKSIKSVSCNGFFAVGGGNDEMIRVVKVSEKPCRMIGSLYEHVASVTSLELFRNTHLLSASEDGHIHVWEIGGIKQHLPEQPQSSQNGGVKGGSSVSFNNHSKKRSRFGKSWDTRCLLRGHKKAVVDLSVHPSGRLLLSVDRGNEMKIWDLVRARCVATVTMPTPAIQVQWCPNGHGYSVVRKNKVMVYTKTGVLYKVLKNHYHTLAVERLDSRMIPAAQKKVELALNTANDIVHSCFILHDLMAIADQSGRITVYDVDSKQLLFQLTGHEPSDPSDQDDSDDHIDEDETDVKDDDDKDHDSLNEEDESPSNDSHRRVRGMKSITVNHVVYLVTADNCGRLCVFDINECLSSIVELSSEDTKAHQSSDDEDTQQSSDDEIVSDSESNGTRNSFGIFEFGPLLQADTEARVTCMDVATPGRLNQMYTWNRRDSMRRVIAKQQTKQQSDGHDDGGETHGSGKRTLSEMKESESGVEREVDEDSVSQSQKPQKPQKKRKKKKKKRRVGPLKPRIDLSRFD